MSAVGNLLQNAFKFTHHHTEVRLNAYAAADRIRIDVEDHCGGLLPGERLLESFMLFKEHEFLRFSANAPEPRSTSARVRLREKVRDGLRN